MAGRVFDPLSLVNAIFTAWSFRTDRYSHPCPQIVKSPPCFRHNPWNSSTLGWRR